MEIKNPILNQIWKDRYCKNNETITENLQRVAKYTSKNEKEEKDFFNMMNERLFFPAGRTMSNAGIGKVLTMNNCFNLNNVPDSISGIFDYIKYGAITQKAGGGTGYNFSLIRPSGTPTSNDAVASGVISFMDTFNSQTHTILQGSRRGANMGILMIYHPDILEYLESKSYDEGKLVHFNLSIMVDNDFMKAKDNNEDIYLHYPCMTEEGELIKDESLWKIKKKINARDLWDLIMKKAYDTGEYGVFFYENLNLDNNLWYIENITGTNPCLTGDMKLLTKDGYKTFKELDGKEIDIININGNITKSKVWKTGDKETIELTLSNGQKIKCTPNHKFMLLDKSECEAKNLIGKKLMPYLNDLPLEKIPTVIFIKSIGIHTVYDFNEPITHWGIVEGFVTHNCGEYVSGVIFGENPKTNEKLNSLDYMGACNLGSLFLHNYVEEPFTKNAKINKKNLKNTIHKTIRMLDNIIDINKFPLPQYENYQKNIRTVGLGHTGIADVLVMLNMVYGSDDAIKFTDNLMNFITKEAYKASIELAKEKGSFNFLDKELFVQSNFIQKHIEKDNEWNLIVKDILQYGIRNAKLISVAPTGTLSLTYGSNCSSGLEPIFSLEYDRKVKIGGQDDKDIQIVKMRDFAYNKWLEFKNNPNCIVTKDKFVTAMDLPVNAHINMLKTIAFHTDMSCSKTINIPTEYSFEDTKKVYDNCYKYGIKGCTIFRPNPLRQGILISEESKGKDEQLKDLKLSRGEWKPIAEDTVYYKRKVNIGCGKIKLFIGWSNSETSIEDLYVIRSGQGGCERNLQGMVIAMSGMFRLGGNIFNIEKAFEGVGSCNSFISQRVKGENLSRGGSCGTAILNEIKAFLKEQNTNNTIVESTVMKCKENSNAKEPFNEDELKYKKKYGDIAFIKKYNKCPLCGSVVRNEGGCTTCPDCGYNKCE